MSKQPIVTLSFSGPNVNSDALIQLVKSQYPELEVKL